MTKHSYSKFKPHIDFFRLSSINFYQDLDSLGLGRLDLIAEGPDLGRDLFLAHGCSVWGVGLVGTMPGGESFGDRL